MFFDFKILRFLTNPRELAKNVQSFSVNGFKKRVIYLFLIGILLFGLRSFWGMNTEKLTPFMARLTTADYTIARYASLIGSLLWSMIYISFHLFGFAYIISVITNIPFKKIMPMQLIMTTFLLAEKALVFLVFAAKGMTASYSFLSLGPLAATFLKQPFMNLFLNQVTITTVLIISYQYKYIIEMGNISQRKRLFGVLLAIHLLMALITASLGFVPIEDFLHKIMGGNVGVGYE